MSPGVKWNVSPGSVTHTTEFFGPLLGVMKFRRLEEAIALVNATGYGLTAGLESLDHREVEQWQDHVRAGNLYINRSTTGAVVLRQPFGGMGNSAVGPGIKAGGPNYPMQFMHFRETLPRPTSSEIANERLRCLRADLLDQRRGPVGADPADLQRLAAAISSYDEAAGAEFLTTHDHARRLGEDNIRRYLPIRELRIRIAPGDTLFELLTRVAAAAAVGCRITVSLPLSTSRADVDWLDERTEPWGGSIEFVDESDETLVATIRQQQTDRIRYAARDRVPEIVQRTAAETGFFVAAAPVYHTGRIELLNYVQEQSISNQYHRYGNLGERTGEVRHEPL